MGIWLKKKKKRKKKGSTPESGADLTRVLPQGKNSKKVGGLKPHCLGMIQREITKGDLEILYSPYRMVSLRMKKASSVW